MSIIAITNQKGGVGKTTTAINLAASLAAMKYRILLVDFDPQGNATAGSGVNPRNLSHSIKKVLLEGVEPAAAITTTPAGYDLLPTGHDLTVAEVQLLQFAGREYYLKRALSLIKDRYDFILIDCPPSLNMLTVNALVASDSVLIPLQCEYFALEGVTSLLATVERLRTTVNPTLAIAGVVRTLYDGRNRLTQDVSAQLKAHFKEKLFHTVIPRNVRLAEAPSHGLPALHYDDASQGAQAYLALAAEFLRAQEQQGNQVDSESLLETMN